MGVISSFISSVNSRLLAEQNFNSAEYLANEEFKHNQKLAEQEFKYNQTLAEEEYNRNLEQWQRENEYNLPANQMLRYQQAGLNPNLIYGQSNLSVSSPTYRSPQYNAPNAPHVNPPYYDGSLQPFNLLSDIFQLMNFKNVLDKGKAEATIAKNNAVSSGYEATMKGQLSAYFGAYQEAKLHNLLINNENAELRNEWQSFLNSTKKLRHDILENNNYSSYYDKLLKEKAWKDLNRYGFDPSKGNWTNWLGGFATNLIDKLIY